MNYKVLIVFILIGAFSGTNKVAASLQNDSVPDSIHALDPDVLLQKIEVPRTVRKKKSKVTPEMHQAVHAFVPPVLPQAATQQPLIPTYIEPVKIDSILLQANPFFIDLICIPDRRPVLPEVPHFNFGQMYFGTPPAAIDDLTVSKVKSVPIPLIVENLRQQMFLRLNREAADLYAVNVEDLPDPKLVRSTVIKRKPLRTLQLTPSNESFRIRTEERDLNIDRFTGNPWTKKASAQAQFTQNYISDNWYQGGNSNFAILGILNGSAIYDNHDRIQWENTAEWRLGVNSVAGDTLRLLNTSDDIFRAYSKFGFKAGGDFYYSTSFEFSTPFFKTFNGVNSKTLKATFLTPVRMYMNIGMDMKYKKLLSVMLSPLSYKYVYINQSDPLVINPNLFGIEKGENHLAELGSQLKAQLNWPVSRELQIDSRFSFYTNYKKVEIDWEIISNFMVNRFLSTRISINPRYDNTVILAGGERAKIQFKELMSFGLSYKFFQ